MNPELILSIIARWLHVGSAIVLLGGTVCLKFVVTPVLKDQSPEWARRYPRPLGEVRTWRNRRRPVEWRIQLHQIFPSASRRWTVACDGRYKNHPGPGSLLHRIRSCRTLKGDSEISRQCRSMDRDRSFAGCNNRGNERSCQSRGLKACGSAARGRETE